MKTRIVALLVIALIALVSWRACRKESGASDAAGAGPRRSATVAVRIQPVRKGSIQDVRYFTGTVSARSSFVVAPKVAGRLEKLAVNIGSKVKRGDLIACLDAQEYERQVEQARAELDVVKANLIDAISALDTATRDLERVRELRKQQVASESEMDQAEARHKAASAKHEVAQAQVKQKEAALKADEIRLSYTRITASWEDGDGPRVVGERYVDEGAMLRANDPVVSILDTRTVIANIFVVERDYPFVQTNQQSTLTTDAFPGKTFSGAIARKAPLLRESSRQARVEIEIPNPEDLLAPGMFVRAGIEFAARSDTTLVPASAIVKHNGKTGVFMADTAAMTARFVPVTTGITSGETVEIIDPPLDGKVVTLGHHLLEDGAAIRIPDEAPPAAGKAPAAGGKKGGSGAPR